MMIYNGSSAHDALVINFGSGKILHDCPPASSNSNPPQWRVFHFQYHKPFLPISYNYFLPDVVVL